jgi:nicotinamidase-related amidase
MPQKKENIHTALLVIDVQQALFERGKPVYKAAKLLENLNQAIENAHQAGVPVIFIQHENDSFLSKDSQGWQLHPRLEIEKEDRVIYKRHPSAFKGTDLMDILAEMSIDHLVIGGLVSHGCVKHTVLDALSRNYSVVLLQDGHSNFSQKAAILVDECNLKMQQAGALVYPTVEVDFM